MMYTAGLDGGSVSVKLVLIGDAGEILLARYERHKGRPLALALEILEDAAQKYPDMVLALTGSTGKAVAKALDAPHISELTAFALSTTRLHPKISTIIEMGGEDSKLILLEDGAISDFAMNSVCAAGTGSFLDQQAERMRLSIEEFSALATLSEHPPRIAGRCSVFAKSDMIHLQQIATPMEDIVAGLCFAVARNFKGSIVRGRKIKPKAAFMGGVAENQGMVRAFREVFELEDLTVPRPPTMMGALGAAFTAQAGKNAPLRLEKLRRAINSLAYDEEAGTKLMAQGDSFFERHMRRNPDCFFSSDQTAGKTDAYMGIDVGSISTCLAVTDEAGRLLAKRYLMTAGRPIEAVKQGLSEIGGEIGERVRIKGVGATGSGRYMIADFTGADIVKNEITAQARGAAFFDSNVDTIFEIGGQDSKFISLENGVISDFTMNKACAAGTGSFLEEQAEKLSVAVKGEFQDLALHAEAPCRLGERCTVFMENSLMASLQRGAAKDNLLAGLAYSIVENYINKVVEGRKIGENIFFQGGTAFNKSVVAAFEKFLDREITVPPNHDVTGSIGMALIARDFTSQEGLAESGFKGFDLARKSYTQASFTCKGCENRCEINKLKIEGEKGFLFYGGRCEKYDIKRKAKGQGLDLFAFREQALFKAHEEYKAAFEKREKPSKKGPMGLPFVFFFHDYLPYYATLLWELGFEPVLSPKTNHAITRLGVEVVLADTCFPVKAALGHVRRLLNEGQNTLFLPSFINMAAPEDPYPTGLGCPLTQSFPYQVRVAFPKAKVLAPVISLKLGDEEQEKGLKKALSGYGISRKALRRAMAEAKASQDRFDATIQAKGREVLNGLTERTMVIVGRSYNAFDSALNLDIPKKLGSLNVQSMPMDFLPEEDIFKDWPEMYWRSGQRILKASRAVKKHRLLYPLFIGNFSCGPDTFINKFVEKELEDKPTLYLEIDEHSADAGVITRVEAFLDSVDSQIQAGKDAKWAESSLEPKLVKPPLSFKGRKKRLIFLPRMADHAFGMEAAFRYCGADAEVLPETTSSAMGLAKKFISGKECYPFAVTTGSMLAKASEPDFNPSRCAFFMPSGDGPCRFGQYNVAQRLILDKAGFPDVPIYSPMQDSQLYEDVGIVGREFSKKSWEGIVAFDLLTKCLHETRPYVKDPAEADAVYAHSLNLIRGALLGKNNELNKTLKGVRRDFEDLPKTGEKKPVIGIVGEIFVRSNKFSNEQIVRGIEALGGEAWLAPIDEWIFYVNSTALRKAKRAKDMKRYMQVRLKEHFQKKIAHSQEEKFNGYLESIHDPPTEQVLKNAAPYLHDSFEGEAVLSIGKAIDMIARGVSGILNAMPFGCMPGTVVTTIMHGVSRKYGIPSISMPYDGTDSPANRLQLEAFMEQAARRNEKP